MDCKIDIIPRLLHFKQPAGTSWEYILPEKSGIFTLLLLTFRVEWELESARLCPLLSCDDLPDYEDILKRICRQVEKEQGMWDKDVLCQYPSILFGLETAIWHFFAGSWALSDTAFHVER